MDNLNKDIYMEAFDMEAKSNTRMSVYADKAREEGFNAVGDTLNEFAKNNKAIARVWLDNAGEIGSLEENLQWGIENSQEKLDFYNKMLSTEETPTLLATTQVMENQLDTLQNTLDSLDTEAMFNPGKTSDWICSRCGFIASGKRCPMHCPLCSCHQGCFRHYRPIRRHTPPPKTTRPGQRPPFAGRR